MTAKTETKTQTYDDALKALEQAATAFPDGQMLLTALKSNTVKERFQEHLNKGHMLMRIIMPEFTTLESFPVSFHFLQAPPGISFTPYLLTAVISTIDNEVVEVFDLADQPVLVKGDKSLPHFRSSLRMMMSVCGDGLAGWGRATEVAGDGHGYWMRSTAGYLSLMSDGFFPWLKPVKNDLHLFGDGHAGYARRTEVAGDGHGGWSRTNLILRLLTGDGHSFWS